MFIYAGSRGGAMNAGAVELLHFIDFWYAHVLLLFLIGIA